MDTKLKNSVKPISVIGGVYSEANGVTRVMRGLADALGRSGSPVTVYGAECYGRTSLGQIFEFPSRWVAGRGYWLGGLSWSPELKKMLRDGIRQADVVHNHSIWMLPNSYSSRLAYSANKPVVITPHGSLEQWAVRHRRWKKRVVGLLFQDQELHAADCIHVMSNAEIDGVRAYGLKCPVAVIPNGIHLPDFDSLPPANAFRDSFPATRDKKIALFMARLHVKKGLEHLIQAWAQLHRGYPDWHFVIAGPDCGFGHRAKQLVDELHLNQSVTFTGSLLGNERLAALSGADVFLHPSFSEGFSIAVLEALACRLPTLITPGCNFREATIAGAAIEVTPDPQSTAEGMRLLLSASDEQRFAMGQKGRTLVENEYTWDGIAEKALELYRWLAGNGERPTFVVDG